MMNKFLDSNKELIKKYAQAYEEKLGTNVHLHEKKKKKKERNESERVRGSKKLPPGRFSCSFFRDLFSALIPPPSSDRAASAGICRVGGERKGSLHRLEGKTKRSRHFFQIWNVCKKFEKIVAATSGKLKRRCQSRGENPTRRPLHYSCPRGGIELCVS